MAGLTTTSMAKGSLVAGLYGAMPVTFMTFIAAGTANFFHNSTGENLESPVPASVLVENALLTASVCCAFFLSCSLYVRRQNLNDIKSHNREIDEVQIPAWRNFYNQEFPQRSDLQEVYRVGSPEIDGGDLNTSIDFLAVQEKPKSVPVFIQRLKELKTYILLKNWFYKENGDPNRAGLILQRDIPQFDQRVKEMVRSLDRVLLVCEDLEKETGNNDYSCNRQQRKIWDLEEAYGEFMNKVDAYEGLRSVLHRDFPTASDYYLGNISAVSHSLYKAVQDISYLTIVLGKRDLAEEEAEQDTKRVDKVLYDLWQEVVRHDSQVYGDTRKEALPFLKELKMCFNSIKSAQTRRQRIVEYHKAENYLFLKLAVRRTLYLRQDREDLRILERDLESLVQEHLLGEDPSEERYTELADRRKEALGLNEVAVFGQDMTNWSKDHHRNWEFSRAVFRSFSRMKNKLLEERLLVEQQAATRFSEGADIRPLLRQRKQLALENVSFAGHVRMAKNTFRRSMDNSSSGMHTLIAISLIAGICIPLYYEFMQMCPSRYPYEGTVYPFSIPRILFS